MGVISATFTCVFIQIVDYKKNYHSLEVVVAETRYFKWVHAEITVMQISASNNKSYLKLEFFFFSIQLFVCNS